MDTQARDLVELEQRFDLQAQAVFRQRLQDTDRYEWAGAEAGVKRMLGLLDQPWDCFLLNGVSLADLPNEAQYKLLQAVSAGAGLVLVGASDERVLKPANLLDPLPAFLAGDSSLQAYRAGQGRGVLLPARPVLPYRPGWEVEWDYWMERVGRALLWAAGKEPRFQLQVSAPASPLTRSAVSGQSLRVSWTGPALPLRVEARLRGSEGEVFPLAGRSSREGGSAGLTYALSAGLPAGTYHADCIARSAQGVEA